MLTLADAEQKRLLLDHDCLLLVTLIYCELLMLLSSGHGTRLDYRRHVIDRDYVFLIKLSFVSFPRCQKLLSVELQPRQFVLHQYVPSVQRELYELLEEIVVHEHV